MAEMGLARDRRCQDALDLLERKRLADVPAIFAVTHDPYIVYTSNIFAVIGLRALYFALENAVHRFKLLKFALAAVLVFIGAKIFLGDLVFDGKFPAVWSLAITVSILATGVIASLIHSRGKPANG